MPLCEAASGQEVNLLRLGPVSRPTRILWMFVRGIALCAVAAGVGTLITFTIVAARGSDVFGTEKALLISGALHFGFALVLCLLGQNVIEDGVIAVFITVTGLAMVLTPGPRMEELPIALVTSVWLATAANACVRWLDAG